MAHVSESYGASWGDLNGDGYPDLFVSNHRTQPSLFLNQGNGTFIDIGDQHQTGSTAPERTRTAHRGPTSTTTATRTCW